MTEEKTEAEIEAEQAAKEQAEAEQEALKAAKAQPEDRSVKQKKRQPVLVQKDQFEREWPTVEGQFPGEEPEFGKEKDGYVELLNEQAPAMAYAASSPAPTAVIGTPERTKHGWEDFVDNSLPPSSDDRDADDIEAAPKRRQQQKVNS